jgi:hypothetical protein
VTEAQKEQTLSVVLSFMSNTVILQANTNTNYVCSYDGGYKSILNLTSSQSFNISGGILKLGVLSNDTTLYFIRVNNSGYLTLFCVDIRFIGEMNSVIYMTDGTICIEKVKINKQSWVYPLINVNSTVSESPATIEFLSSNISNCVYFYNETTSPYKSGIIFFTNTSTQKLNMTILLSSFLNNLFYFSSSSSACGSGFHFHGQNSTSGINYFFFKLFNIS